MKNVTQEKSAGPRPAIPGVAVDGLFAEVAGILEEARRQTVRSINTPMVTAYWLVGWRIVEAEQGGKTRAGYGDRLLENLSVRLTKRFGKGYSVANLKNFREVYLAYPDRLGGNRYPLGSELEGGTQARGVALVKRHFEPNVDYQHAAIESVWDLFRGQETCRTEFTVTQDALGVQQALAFAQNDLGIGNRLHLLDDVQELAQRLHRITQRGYSPHIPAHGAPARPSVPF